ncbi:MAG: DoxX family protein [Acidobacteria bacterium]|nr:DoxX family protein [Acidobacteriota bacterium]
MLNGYGEIASIPAYGPAVLRLVVGVVFVAHGAQKLFGVLGGDGLSGTSAAFSQMGLEPAYAFAVVVGALEFGGGLLLLVGALTFFASLALVLVRTGAIWKVHLAHGFFLSDNGYEYNLTLIAALVCLMLAGPGALSIDRNRASHAAAAAAGRARLRWGA